MYAHRNAQKVTKLMAFTPHRLAPPRLASTGCKNMPLYRAAVKYLTYIYCYGYMSIEAATRPHV